MEIVPMSRRAVLQAGLVTLGAHGLPARRRATAAPPELGLPTDGPDERFDFEAQGIEGWTTVSGQWAVEEVSGAPSGKRALVQRATRGRRDRHPQPQPRRHAAPVRHALLGPRRGTGAGPGTPRSPRPDKQREIVAAPDPASEQLPQGELVAARALRASADDERPEVERGRGHENHCLRRRGGAPRCAASSTPSGV
jgi:hypothetical protein